MNGMQHWLSESVPRSYIKCVCVSGEGGGREGLPNSSRSALRGLGPVSGYFVVVVVFLISDCRASR